MSCWKALISSGVRVYFTVVKAGNLVAGLAAGVFTVTLINQTDSSSTVLTVTQSTQKPGVYYVDVPSAFITTNGTGDYGLSIGVHSVGPKIDDEVLFSVEVTDTDLSTIVTTIIDGVWDENKSGHITANTYGKIVQDLETLIKQVKSLTAANL